MKELGDFLDASPWLESVTTKTCLMLANALYSGMELHKTQKDDQTLPQNSKILRLILSSAGRARSAITAFVEHWFPDIHNMFKDRVENLADRIKKFVLMAEETTFDYAYYKPYEAFGRTAIAAIKWLHDRSDTATIWHKDLEELEDILHEINVFIAEKERLQYEREHIGETHHNEE